MDTYKRQAFPWQRDQEVEAQRTVEETVLFFLANKTSFSPTWLFQSFRIVLPGPQCNISTAIPGCLNPWEPVQRQVHRGRSKNWTPEVTLLCSRWGKASLTSQRSTNSAGGWQTNKMRANDRKTLLTLPRHTSLHT